MAAVRASVFLAASDPTAVGFSYLTNGSFNANVVPWAAIAGTVVWNGGTGPNGLAGFARFTKDGSGIDAAGIWGVAANPAAPIGPGTFTGTAKVRAATTAREAQIAIASFTSTGAFISLAYGPRKRLVPGSWVDISGPSYVVPPEGITDTRLIVYVFGAAGGEVFDVDDGTLWRTSGAAPRDDISCWVDSVSVKYGRDDAWTAVSPSSVTLGLTAGAVDQVSPLLITGAWLLVTVPDPLTGNVIGRFCGKISDVTWTWDDAGEDTPYRASAQVIAASRITDGTRTESPAYAPTTPNRELGTLGQLMTGAGNPLYIGPIGTAAEVAAGGAPINVPAQAAGWSLWDSVQTMADATGAFLFEDPGTGYGVYCFAGLYISSWWGAAGQAVTTLDACDFRAGVAWDLVFDVVNSVTVTSPAQPVTVVEDTTSQALFGKWSLAWTSWINTALDLGSRISFLSASRTYPEWDTDALDIATDDIAADKYSALLNARCLTTFRLTAMPSWAGPPAQDAVRIEGWSETFSTDGNGEPVHEFLINVTAGLLDFTRPVPPGPVQNRWTDATKTWSAIPADQSWWDSWQAGKV